MIDWDGLVIGPTTSAFGETVTYNGAGFTLQIVGVFDEAFLELTPLGRGDLTSEGISFGLPGAITTAMPVLGVQLSQFVSGPPQQSDTLQARGATYTVKEVQTDGHGWARLLLVQ